MEYREACEIINKQLCYEICQIAENIQRNSQMSMQDLDKLDKLYHAWKSKYTTEAMKEAEEYDNGGYSETGMSGARGRSPYTGRYVSRASYDDGYAHGYSEAMSHMDGNSGHYPMYPPRMNRW